MSNNINTQILIEKLDECYIDLEQEKELIDSQNDIILEQSAKIQFFEQQLTSWDIQDILQPCCAKNFYVAFSKEDCGDRESKPAITTSYQHSCCSSLDTEADCPEGIVCCGLHTEIVCCSLDGAVN